MKLKLSAKRIAIDRAQFIILVASGLAVFIVIFSLVSAKAMMEQRAYQSRVISKKSAALKQAKQNIVAVKTLQTSFQVFNSENPNVLEGNASGTGDKDGENARIVLDALPSKYDFPALTSSVEKVFKDGGYPLTDVTGVDDEVAQSQAQSASVPIEIPFSSTIIVQPSSASQAVQILEKSIRPIAIVNLKFKIEENENPKLTISGKTYYQPSKNFKVETEQVR